MIKNIIKVIGVIVITYATIVSCTVMTVVILDQSLNNTKSTELFPD